MSTWTSLWNATYTSIPSALYGGTNIREWFAELWRCQVPSPASPNGDVSSFLQLCGNDRTKADTVRATFTAALPMPTFTY